MIKRLFVGVIAALMLSVAAFAGPTVSLGTAWYNDQFDFGVGVGMQANKFLWDFVGAEVEFVVGDVSIDPYDDPLDSGDFSYLYGLARLDLTFAIPSGDTGPQWYFIYGIGAPGIIAWDSDNASLTGFNIGTTFGIACETPSGHGVTILGYWEDGAFGVGAEVYVDLFGIAAKNILNVESTVERATVSETVEIVPASKPCDN